MKFKAISISLAIACFVGILADCLFSEAFESQQFLLAQSPNSQENEVRQLLKQGNQAFETGQLQEALKLWKQGLLIAESMTNLSLQGSLLINLGIVYRGLGELEKSFEYFDKAKLIYQHHKYSEETKLLENIGINYWTLADYDTSLDYFQQTLKLVQANHDLTGEASVLSNIALVYTELNNYDQAIQAYNQSLELAEKLNLNNIKGNILHNRGSVYQTLGKNAGNQKYIKQAFDDYQQSLVISRETGDKGLECSVLGSLGFFYRNQEKNYLKAIEYYQQSLALARQLGNLEKIAMALNNLGRNQFNAKQFSEAEKSLQEAIDIWDKFRSNLPDQLQISQFDTLVTYILLQRVLVAQKRYDEALEIAEHGRARAFVNLLTKKLSANPQFISKLKLSLQEIKKIAQTQNATLVEYSIIPEENDQLRYGRQQSQGTPGELYIWVVQPTGKIEFRQVDLKSKKIALDELVKSGRESLGVRGRGASIELVAISESASGQTQRLQQLYQILIQPIAELLPTNPEEKVIFIPHRSLYLVPFTALQDPQNNYLISQHTIITSPAIQILNFTHQIKQQHAHLSPEAINKILIVGNPVMPSLGNPPKQLPSLPGAEQEAIAIAKLLLVKPLLNQEATETAIIAQLPNARIIHLATHGLLDNTDATGENARGTTLGS
ncbi:MAG: CHAT domain-containing protein [Microcystis aeruginosa G11-04]|uniref:CHAT domain-containing protein n=1 Tax=Microcystis aeruginosa G11-04 TaxID=2685956 RepID=A0A966FX00_MICAE|nr:CHAT domain-containing protein [Microcystis aeruginosa G11-04]